MRKVISLIILLIVIAGLYFLTQNNRKNPLSINSINSQTGNDSNTNPSSINNDFVLEITKPIDKSTVSDSMLKVEGKTGANAEVFINEVELKADPSGFFSVDYELFEGENNLYISANDDKGNFLEKMITVYLESTE